MAMERVGVLFGLDQPDVVAGWVAERFEQLCLRVRQPASFLFPRRRPTADPGSPPVFTASTYETKF